MVSCFEIVTKELVGGRRSAAEVSATLDESDATRPVIEFVNEGRGGRRQSALVRGQHVRRESSFAPGRHGSARLNRQNGVAERVARAVPVRVVLPEPRPHYSLELRPAA